MGGRPKTIIKKGQRFNRYTVLDFAGSKNGHLIWRCKCDCGTIKEVVGSSLVRGTTVSCGCYRLDAITKTGYSRTRLHKIWSGMKRRTENPNDIGYKHYGLKGIKICDEWQDVMVFHKWALANGYSDSLTIDRIDNTKGYSPDNCRWVTQKEQQNNRTNNHYITYQGKTQTLKMWCEELSLDYNLIRRRIGQEGWCIERAFTTPKLTKWNHRKGAIN